MNRTAGHLAQGVFEKRGLCLVLALLLLLFVPQTARSGEAAPGTGLLWQVKGKTNTVYLLGSLHVMTPDQYPLPDPIEQAYLKSRMIVLEANPDDTAGPAFQESLIKLGLFPPGQRLRQHLSSATHTRLRQKVESNGLKMAEFERLRPWLAGVTLGALEFQRLGFSPEYGIDQHFFGRARKDGKKAAFLETADFQISLFSSLVDAEAETLLRQMLDEMDELKPLATDMLNAWRTGNDERLYQLVHKGFTDYPDLYEKIMLNRNRNWIPDLERLLGADQDVFVVVGAGHLVGPGSVVDLLRKRGYSIRR